MINVACSLQKHMHMHTTLVPSLQQCNIENLVTKQQKARSKLRGLVAKLSKIPPSLLYKDGWNQVGIFGCLPSHTVAMMPGHLGDGAAVGLYILTSLDAFIVKEVLEIVQHWLGVSQVTAVWVVSLEEFFQIHDAEIAHDPNVVEPHSKPEPPLKSGKLMNIEALLSHFNVQQHQHNRRLCSIAPGIGLYCAQAGGYCFCDSFCP